MKKLLVPLLATVLISGCEKQISNETVLESNTASSAKGNPEKMQICHYDTETKTWHTINISVNALSAHQQQGDVLGDCSAVITKICDQTWTVKNLDVDHYRNGDLIPQVTDRVEWATLTTGAWCYYDNFSNNGIFYGKLYNWYAVNDSRGLAPIGWHIPSDAEWATLSDCIGHGESSIVGIAMKSTTGWIDGNGTNSSGFTGLPSGYRFSDDLNSYFLGGGSPYYSLGGDEGRWWTTTLSSTGVPMSQGLSEFHSFLSESYYLGISNRSIGYSVRCVKD